MKSITQFWAARASKTDLENHAHCWDGGINTMAVANNTMGIYVPFLDKTYTWQDHQVKNIWLAIQSR